MGYKPPYRQRVRFGDVRWRGRNLTAVATTPDPGLDLAALRGLRAPSARTGTAAIADITARIEAHLAAHDGYVAFSGGKDSLDRPRPRPPLEPDVPVVFFDSGLDYPETYDYLTELAQAWKLDLHRIPTDPPLLDVLADSGLWDHTAPVDAAAARVDLHEVLITEPARRAHRLLGPGELWGVRADDLPPAACFTPALAAATVSLPAWTGRWRTARSGTGPPPTSGPTLPDTGCRSTRSTAGLRELGVPEQPAPESRTSSTATTSTVDG